MGVLDNNSILENQIKNQADKATCEFCHAVLNDNYKYCPKCGKRISKIKENNSFVPENDLFFTEEDGGDLLITGYNGFADKEIVIPAAIDGKFVIGIWNNVFENCNELESVVFEEGCKYIGKKAFANCTKLRKVKLPESLLEIGDFAFRGCDIKEITIPSNVKVIGSYAFSYCNLKNIILPEGLKCISAGMLSNTLIQKIDIPQSVIHIEFSAFSDTKLVEVELPRNLYSIGEYAFDIAGLLKVTMHSNIEIIEKNIFGMNREETDPVIYCSRGSKGLLYARKYRLRCVEIPVQPKENISICARGIDLELGGIKSGEEIATWYKYWGLNKAETWSWNIIPPNVLHIDKAMEMEEAIHLLRIMKEFINKHSDWSRKNAICALQNLSIYEYWGESDV